MKISVLQCGAKIYNLGSPIFQVAALLKRVYDRGEYGIGVPTSLCCSNRYSFFSQADTFCGMYHCACLERVKKFVSNGRENKPTIKIILFFLTLCIKLLKRFEPHQLCDTFFHGSACIINSELFLFSPVISFLLLLNNNSK